MSAKSHVLAGLIEKRSDLSGQIEETKRRLGQLIKDVQAIDHAIILFDPNADVLAIPTKTRAAARARAQVGGDVGRDTLNIIRRAARPLSVREIAEGILADRKIDPSDDRAARAARNKVNSAVRRFAAQGLL